VNFAIEVYIQFIILHFQSKIKGFRGVFIKNIKNTRKTPHLPQKEKANRNHGLARSFWLSMAVVVAVVVVVPGSVLGLLQTIQAVVADINDLVQQFTAVHLGFFIHFMADVAACGRAVLVTAAYGKQRGGQQERSGQRQR
jgi:hypothetical protein